MAFLACPILGQAAGLAGGKKKNKRYGVYAIAFYNLENLFDTEDDPTNKGDDPFLPNGAYNWTPEKYQQKLHNIAYAISKLAKEHCPGGPAAIGVAEVENRKVLEDLVATEPLASMGYKVIHFESPDHRGIDVGLLYNPRLFHVEKCVTYEYHYEPKPWYHTRDQLLVRGIMAGEPVNILVNHWPSKYGGPKTSIPLRNHAAKLSRHIADSVCAASSKNKMIVMGDLNDDPDADCCAKVFGAAPTVKSTPRGGYFNATWPLFTRGIGTLCYQDVWGLYDQQMISANFLRKNAKRLKFWKTEVFNPDFLITKSGKKKGYPKRSFLGRKWDNGYADHFPTITYYIKEMK